MELLIEKSDLDMLADRLSRKITLKRTDDFESIKAKLRNALSSDSNGRKLLSPKVWNDAIVSEIIPRLVWKAQTGKGLGTFKKERKDTKLKDFVKG